MLHWQQSYHYVGFKVEVIHILRFFLKLNSLNFINEPRSFPMCITLQFYRFRFRSQVFDYYSCILSKLHWSSSTSLTLLIIEYLFISSANIPNLHQIVSAISLYKTKSSGPSTNPWGFHHLLLITETELYLTLTFEINHSQGCRGRSSQSGNIQISLEAYNAVWL